MSRSVSRSATNQVFDGVWHHHSFFTPGAPLRLKT
jgi:hypothetical protein